MCRLWSQNPLPASLILVALILPCGCYHLAVDRSSPLRIDLKEFQPIAVLPLPAVRDDPKIASEISASVRDFLLEKGYLLVPPSVVNQGLEGIASSGSSLLSDSTSLHAFADRTRARLLLVASILEYHAQKSYISESTSQVWTGPVYSYETLPTYYQGMMDMRLALKLWDPQKNELVWMAEGHASGPTGTAALLAKGLVKRLLADLSPLPRP